MTYEYELSKKHAEKYGFTHLLADGWFGYYADEFNKKFDNNNKKYVEISLTENQIDEIVKDAIEIREY